MTDYAQTLARIDEIFDRIIELQEERRRSAHETIFAQALKGSFHDRLWALEHQLSKVDQQNVEADKRHWLCSELRRKIRELKRVYAKEARELDEQRARERKRRREEVWLS